MDPAVARRNSASSASPFLKDVYFDTTEGNQKSDKLSVVECLRLAKAMSDHSQLPQTCREYIEKHLAVQKAYEGAGGNMAARATIAKHATKTTGGLTHAQLQRRWTSHRDPLEKKKSNK